MKNKIRVITEFQGSNPGYYSVVDNKVFIRYKEENVCKYGTIFDYAWSFTLGVENMCDEEAKIRVFVNIKENENFKGYPALIFSTKSLNDEFALTHFKSKTDGYKKYFVEFKLSPGEILYLSNTVPRGYDIFMSRLIDRMQKGKIKLQSIGFSAENREICSFRFGENECRPNILVTTGFHPSEPDTFASEEIMNYLTEESSILNHFNVYLVPVVNPDGFVDGLNGANANRINIYWKFNYKNKEEIPEAYYLWEFIKEIKPILYVDFHCYTQQQHKEPGPYLKPDFFYCGKKVIAIKNEMDKYLEKVSRGKPHQGLLSVLPTTLGYLVTKRFNTLAYVKYHFHLKYGIDDIKKSGLLVFKGLLEILIRHNINDSNLVLKRPYGKIHSNIMNTLRSYTYLMSRIFYYRIKSIIARFKKI